MVEQRHNASRSRSTTTNNNIPNGRLLGHRDSVEQLRFSPAHTDELVSVSSDKTVKFWDVRQKKKCNSYRRDGCKNINVAWSPTGRRCRRENDTLTFIDCTTMRAVKTASGKEVEVRHRKPISRKVFKETEVNEFAWDRERSRRSFRLTGTERCSVTMGRNEAHD